MPVTSLKFRDVSDGNVIGNRRFRESAGIRATYEWECYDGSGTLKWKDRNHNLVVNEGLTQLLKRGFAGSEISSFTTWKVGLVSGSSVSPSAAWIYDTLPSHFTEATAYSGSRQAATWGSVASQAVDNSGSKASFTVTGSSQVTVCGAFLASGPNAGTKGDHTGGDANCLYSVSEFSSGAKTLDPADVLKVTITLSAADDGA